MIVITGVEKYEKRPGDICVFLAGGITNCADWQKEVIKCLENHTLNFAFDNLVILNPRRDNFPIHDPNASKEQIEWEFNMLEMCDVFSMYFSGGVSDQPICMYELGRNLVRMCQKFNHKINGRIIVSVEDGYRRIEDVRIQTDLAVGLDNISRMIGGASPEKHADLIALNYMFLQKKVKIK